MSDFRCRCVKCNKENSYRTLKDAFLDGWNIGLKAVCWDCQQFNNTFKPDALTVEILGIEG